MALLSKVPNSISITVSVSTGETLVGGIEESNVVLLLHDLADLAPLSLSRVDSSRVVSTGVEQDGALGRGSLQVLDQTDKVKPDGVLVVVAVLDDLKTGVLEDGIVVGPAGSRDVDLLAGGETFEESCTYPQGTGSRDGLCDGDAVLLDDGGFGTESELRGSLGECWDTGDSGVFLVQARTDYFVLRSTNGRENVWLPLVVTCPSITTSQPQLSPKHIVRIARAGEGLLTVSSNTEIDLLLVGIGLESLGDTKNGILQKRDKPDRSAKHILLVFLLPELHRVSRARLTGGPWGTFDHDEAARAPVARARIPDSRPETCRVAILSIVL